MYGRGSVSAIISGGVTTGSGVAILPYTAGNPTGAILAYTAITIGVLILGSQLIVRILRKIYQK
jgi:hypothetical protein